jgi:hypothetical protein
MNFFAVSTVQTGNVKRGKSGTSNGYDGIKVIRNVKLIPWIGRGLG